MPLKFTAICDLFQNLEQVISRDPPYLPAQKDKKLRQSIQLWFRTHRKALDHGSDRLAVLSSLLPDRRTDRVYGIQSKLLEKIVGRCLVLGEAKYRELGRWRERGGGDLGECVERIEKDFDCCPLPVGAPLTVEEVDAALTQLAARCRFSGPEVMKRVTAAIPDQILKPMMRQMHSREKKWFVRMILKSMGLLQADSGYIEKLLLEGYHFLLPLLLKFNNDLTFAANLLRGPLNKFPANPDPQSRQVFLEEAEGHIVRPQIGVKVGRPHWIKARSFKNCLDLVAHGQWIIERKYDGEYVEIHIDLTKGRDCIKIFSKNGRDSTQDRRELHKILRQCLRIGQEDCKIQDKCILLGEMVVWSDLEQKVLGFEKVRKFVSRAGSFIGTDKDSQPHPHEHLMIAFFDVLMVDGELTMTKPHEQRRKRLSSLLTKIPGRASTVEWKLLDFATKKAQKSLVVQFTAALVQRCEGLVLKPNASYFSLAAGEPRSGYRGFIKLKKDYMTDLGGERDVADFAVIGASYEVQQAQKAGQQRLRWTNFCLGCLMDDEQAKYRSRPKFKIVAIIKQDQCIPPPDLKFLNQHGQFRETEYDPDGIDEFDIQIGRNPSPDVLFRNPFVVEILGSAFEKPANEDFWMLRHPRVLKIHNDRSWEDCITVSGLARIADEARNAPAEGESQETRRLVEKLYGKMKRAEERQRSTTPRSATTESPSSVVRRAIHLANEAGSHSPSAVAQIRPVQSAGKISGPSKAPLQRSPEPCPNPATFGVMHPISNEVLGREASTTQLTTHTQTILSPRSSQVVQWPREEISPPKRRSLNVDGVGGRPQYPNSTTIQLQPANLPHIQGTEPVARQSASVNLGHAQSSTNKDKPVRQLPKALDAPVPKNGSATKGTEQRSSLKPPKTLGTHGANQGHSRGAQREESAGVGSASKQVNPSMTVVESVNQPVISLEAPQPPGRGDSLPTPKSTPGNPVSAEKGFQSVMAPLTPKVTPRQPDNVEIVPPTPRPSSRKENMAPPFPTGTPTATKDKVTSSRSSMKKPLRPLELPSSSPDLSLTRSKSKRAAVDDFDVDMIPRKIPKWGSGNISCSITTPISSPSPSSSSSSCRPIPKTTHTAGTTPPQNLPYALAHTAILLPPYLHANNAALRDALSALDASGPRIGALVTDMRHWQRDATVYEPLGPVVGESQAYASWEGWSRIVLVESASASSLSSARCQHRLDPAGKTPPSCSSKDFGGYMASDASARWLQRVRHCLGDCVAGTALFDWRVLVALQQRGYGWGKGGQREASIWETWFRGSV